MVHHYSIGGNGQLFTAASSYLICDFGLVTASKEPIFEVDDCVSYWMIDIIVHLLVFVENLTFYSVLQRDTNSFLLSYWVYARCSKKAYIFFIFSFRYRLA